MKIYTGVDIVSNLRIKQAYDKFRYRFLDKIYTEKEIEYCLKKKEFVNCLAARFAAKEAFIKAFYKYSGFKPSFKEIEILGQEGKPATLKLHLKDININICQIDISISHEKDYSLASVIIYTD